MKTLSIEQPLAWAICNLPREFRMNCINQTWESDKRGITLICANSKFSNENYQILQETLSALGYEGDIPKEKDFLKNHIIGGCRVVDCVEGEFDSPWSVNPEHHTVYKLVLEDMYPLRSPIKCKDKPPDEFFSFSLLS